MVGIDIDCNSKHSENASLPIDITLDGIVIIFNFVQSEKAEWAIDITLGGIE